MNIRELTKNRFFLLSLALTALLAFQVYGIVSAEEGNYTAPQGPPTTMTGVYAPLNTGPGLQTKTGALTVSGAFTGGSSLTIGSVGKVRVTSGGQIHFLDGGGNTKGGIRFANGVLQFNPDDALADTKWKPFGTGTGGPGGLAFGSVVDNSSVQASIIKYGVLDIDGVSYLVPLYKRSTDQDFSVNYLGPNPTSNSHTSPQCVALGGTPTVVDTGVQEVPNQPQDDIWICKLSVRACPNTWIQYENWSETNAVTCSLTQTGSATVPACTTNSHIFENIPTETCSYLGGTCYSEIVALGCY